MRRTSKEKQEEAEGQEGESQEPERERESLKAVTVAWGRKSGHMDETPDTAE